jgi:hypothetical protein
MQKKRDVSAQIGDRNTMTTHILSLTYPPKIPLVKSGECTQTIRLHNPDRPKKVGDKLILHTWEGKPYRSKWDWRLETEISELLPVMSQWEWFGPEDKRCHMAVWRLDVGYMQLSSGQIITNYRVLETEEVEDIIKRDGITPIKYQQLEKTLERLNGIESTDQEWWDIIRWPRPTEA